MDAPMHVERIAPSRPPQGRTLLQPGDSRHGTVNGYNNHGCRCKACRKAWAVYHTTYNHRVGRHRPRAVVSAERRAAAETRDNHGTETRYHRGCRCDPCREASRVARANRRAIATQPVLPKPDLPSGPPLV